MRRVDSKKSYGKYYDEFEDFENDDEYRNRQKYQRERSEHRYFKFEKGRGVYEKGEDLPKKKAALIWGGKEKKSPSLTKFQK